MSAGPADCTLNLVIREATSSLRTSLVSKTSVAVDIMDPFSAIGLVANILLFIEKATVFIDKARFIDRSTPETLIEERLGVEKALHNVRHSEVHVENSLLRHDSIRLDDELANILYQVNQNAKAMEKWIARNLSPKRTPSSAIVTAIKLALNMKELKPIEEKLSLLRNRLVN